MPKCRPDTGTRHEHEIELKLAYLNVGQTIQMWTGRNAKDHQDKFARTIEVIMLNSQVDILWLCEVGNHSDGLAGSEVTPKQVLQRRKKLNDQADVIDGLGPYLILVRKNISIDQEVVAKLQRISVPGGRSDQKFALSRFRIGSSTLVGVVAHVPRGSQEKGHKRARLVSVRKKVLHSIVECIKDKGWHKNATVVLGGDFNFCGYDLDIAMQAHQPPDGAAAPGEVWRIFRTVHDLKGDCFAYKGISSVQDLEIILGVSYKDSGWRGCLDAHDVVAAKVVLTSFQNERSSGVAHDIADGSVAQHTKDTSFNAFALLNDTERPRSSTELGQDTEVASVEEISSSPSNSDWLLSSPSPSPTIAADDSEFEDASNDLHDDSDAGTCETDPPASVAMGEHQCDFGHQGGNHKSTDADLHLTAVEQQILSNVDTFTKRFWFMMEEGALPVDRAFRNKAYNKLFKFIFAKIEDVNGGAPRMRSRIEVMRSIKELFGRRSWLEPCYAADSDHCPRTLSVVEMKAVMKLWKNEYEQSDDQQQKIHETQESDRKRRRKDQVTDKRRHGRFNLHIRRTHGNAAVCRCIIQTGRFDDVLLDAMMESLRKEKEPVDDDQSRKAKKIRKMKATSAHRHGRYLAKRIEQDSNAWYTFSRFEKYLWYAYKDGRLVVERNAAARALGTGSLFNPQDEETAQLTLEKCFAYRTIEQTYKMSSQWADANPHWHTSSQWARTYRHW